METELADLLDSKLKSFFEEFLATHLHIIINYFCKKRIASIHITKRIRKSFFYKYKSLGSPKQNIHIVYRKKRKKSQQL